MARHYACAEIYPENEFELPVVCVCVTPLTWRYRKHVLNNLHTDIQKRESVLSVLIVAEQDEVCRPVWYVGHGARQIFKHCRDTRVAAVDHVAATDMKGGCLPMGTIGGIQCCVGTVTRFIPYVLLKYGT